MKYQSEEKLRLLFDTQPECVKLVRRDGTIVDMNSAGLCMLQAESPDQVLGQCVFNLIVPEQRSAFIEFHERVCSGEKAELRFEITGIMGRRLWVESHAVPFYDDGEVLQLAITRDISAQKRTEEDLRASQALLEAIRQANSLYMREGKVSGGL